MPPPESGSARLPLGRRLAWFAGLALGGVLATAALAYGLHVLLFLR